jgi:hypothetical protein
MSIISSLKNNLKKSIGGPGFETSLNPSGRRSWAGLGGLARGRALKAEFNGTTAQCLIVACRSQSLHSSTVRFNGSLTHRIGSV